MKKYFKLSECLSRISGTTRDSFAGILGNGKGRKGAKHLEERRLQLESLEERQLLAVTAAEYEAIRQAFGEFDLPQNQDDTNIIEVTDLTASAIQKAVDQAGASSRNDLIVFRTGALDAAVNLGDSQIVIDNDVQKAGTLSIVALGDDGSQQKLNLITTADEAFDVSDDTAFNLGNIQVNGIYENSYSSAVNATAEVNYVVIFSGGGDAANNHRRYYDAVRNVYNTSISVYDVKPENIYVLYADGTNAAADMNIGCDSTITVNSDMSFATENGSAVLSATYANLQSVMQTVGSKMDGNDHLLIYTADHGGGEVNKPEVIGEEVINGWNENITCTDFANAVFNVKAGYVTLIETQCFSGGILSNVIDPVTGKSLNPNISVSDAETKWYGMAAANHYEYSISICEQEYSEEYGTYIYTENGCTGFDSGALTPLAKGIDTTAAVFVEAKTNDPAAVKGEVYNNNEGVYTEGEEHPWGAGATFNIFSRWTAEKLEAPEILSLVSTTSSTMTMSISESANAGGYTVQWSTESDFSTYKSKMFTGTDSLIITGLKAGTKYYFRVKANPASDLYAESEWSDAESAKVKSLVPPSQDDALFIFTDGNDEANQFYVTNLQSVWVCATTGVTGSTYAVLQDADGTASVKFSAAKWENAQFTFDNDNYAYWKEGEDGVWTWQAPEDNVVLQRSYDAFVWNDADENGVWDEGEEKYQFTVLVEWANISVCVDEPAAGTKTLYTADDLNAGHSFWDNRTSETLLSSGIFANTGDLYCYVNISEGFGPAQWDQSVVNALANTGNYIDLGQVQLTKDGKTQFNVEDGERVFTDKTASLVLWENVDAFKTFTISSLSDYMQLLEYGRSIYEYFTSDTRAISVTSVQEYIAQYDEIQNFIGEYGFVPAYVLVQEDAVGGDGEIAEQQSTVAAITALRTAGITVAAYEQGGTPSGGYDFEYEWTEEVIPASVIGKAINYTGTSPAHVGEDLVASGGAYTADSGLGTVTFSDMAGAGYNFPMPSEDGGYSVSDIRAFLEMLNSHDASDVSAENLAALEAYMMTLSSRMSENVIYLDFGQNGPYMAENADGELVAFTKYSADYSQSRDYFTFNELKAVYTTWLTAMEECSGLDVNVTLDLAQYQKAQEEDASRVHVVIGGSADDWYGAGEVERPVYVVTSDEFTDENIFYVFAAGEDDGAVIGSWVKEGLESFDIFESESAADPGEWTNQDIYSAKELDLSRVLSSTEETLVGSGYISEIDQADFYKLDFEDGGTYHFNISGLGETSKIDLQVNLYNAVGELIRTYNSADSQSVEFVVGFDSGVYYLSVYASGKAAEENIGMYDIRVKKGTELRVTTTSDVVDSTDGVMSLREAVNILNNMSDSEVAFIFFDQAGTYNLNSELVIKHSVTFQSEGKAVVLTANGRSRLFSVDGAVLTLDEISLSRGYAADGAAVHVAEGASFYMNGGEIYNCQATGSGGALYNAGTAELNGVTLRNNSAANGAAVANIGTFTGKAVTFSTNTATGDGGAFYQTGEKASAVFTDLEVAASRAANGGAFAVFGGTVSVTTAAFNDCGATAGNGGAFYLNSASASVVLNYITVEASSAVNGGAAAVIAGSLSIKDSTLTKNSASTDGGVIYGSGTAEANAVIWLTDTEMIENKAANYGGAIALYDAALLNAQGVTIGSNSALLGAGVYVSGASAVVSGSTVLENTLAGTVSDVYRGAGFYAEKSANLTLSNTTVKKHRIVSSGPNVFGCAVYAVNSTLTINETSYIEHNEIVANSVSEAAAAGVYAAGCKVRIEKAYIQNNVITVSSGSTMTAYGSGAALTGGTTSVVDDTEFYMNEIKFTNTSVSTATGRGAALYSDGPNNMELTDSRFIQNTLSVCGSGSVTAQGGAVYSLGGRINGIYAVQNTLYADTRATGGSVTAQGGAVYSNTEMFNSVIAETMMWTRTSSLATNNAQGAAVYSGTGMGRVVNCTITDNYGFRHRYDASNRGGNYCYNFFEYVAAVNTHNHLDNSIIIRNNRTGRYQQNGTRAELVDYLGVGDRFEEVFVAFYGSDIGPSAYSAWRNSNNNISRYNGDADSMTPGTIFLERWDMFLYNYWSSSDFSSYDVSTEFSAMYSFDALLDVIAYEKTLYTEEGRFEARVNSYWRQKIKGQTGNATYDVQVRHNRGDVSWGGSANIYGSRSILEKYYSNGTAFVSVTQDNYNDWYGTLYQETSVSTGQPFFAAYGTIGSQHNLYNWVAGDYHLNASNSYVLQIAVDAVGNNYTELTDAGLTMTDASGANRAYDWENQETYDKQNPDQSICRKIDIGAYELQMDTNIRVYDEDDYRVIEFNSDEIIVTTLWDYVNPYDGVISLREALGYYDADGNWVNGYANDGTTIRFADFLIGGGLYLTPIWVKTPFQAITSTLTINRSIAIDASSRKDDREIGIYLDGTGRLDYWSARMAVSSTTNDESLFVLEGNGVEITIDKVDIQWKEKILPQVFGQYEDLRWTVSSALLNSNVDTSDGYYSTHQYANYRYDYDTCFTRTFYLTNMKGIISTVTDGTITLENCNLHDFELDGMMFADDTRLTRYKDIFVFGEENDGTAINHQGSGTTIALNNSHVYDNGAQNYDTIKGGAIYISGGDLAVNGTTIEDCYAVAIYEAFGGAVYVENGNVVIDAVAEVADEKYYDQAGYIESSFENNMAVADYTNGYKTLEARFAKYYSGPMPNIFGDRTTNEPRDIRSGFDPSINAKNSIAQGGALYICKTDNSAENYTVDARSAAFLNNTAQAFAQEYEIKKTFTATAEGGAFFIGDNVDLNISLTRTGESLEESSEYILWTEYDVQSAVRFEGNSAKASVASNEFIAVSENSDFVPKKDDSWAYAAGGAVYKAGSAGDAVTIEGAVITGNSAEAVSDWGAAQAQGGGIYIDGTSNVTMTDTYAVLCRYADPEIADTILEFDSTIAGNSVIASAGFTAIGKGAGVLSKSEENRLSSTKFLGNTMDVSSRQGTAEGYGAGLYAEGNLVVDAAAWEASKTAFSVLDKYEPLFNVSFSENAITADGNKAYTNGSTDLSAAAYGAGLYFGADADKVYELASVQANGNKIDILASNAEIEDKADIEAGGAGIYLADPDAETFIFDSSVAIDNSIIVNVTSKGAGSIYHDQTANVKGAGIYNEADYFTAAKSSFARNRGENNSVAVGNIYGGGLYSEAVNVYIYYGRFIENDILASGEAFGGAVCVNNENAEIAFGTDEDGNTGEIYAISNTAAGADARGGVMYANGAALTIAAGSYLCGNSALADDSEDADGRGGVLYADGGEIIINEGTAFNNNTASTSGGAIYHQDGESLFVNGNHSGNVTFNGNTAGYYGGAVYSSNNGGLLFYYAVFNGNVAETGDGGAVYSERNDLEIYSSEFSGNSAGSYGGAVYALKNGGTVIDTSLFNSNRARGFGGAVYYNGTQLTVEGTQFTLNRATGDNGEGGAICNVSSQSLEVSNSSFTENEAVNYGGAVYCFTTLKDGETGLNITNTDFAENITTGENGRGGAIYNNGGSLVMTGDGEGYSRMIKNASSADGGALFNVRGDVTITDYNFTDNSAVKNGGAIYAHGRVNNTMTMKTTNSSAAGEISNNTAGVNGGAVYVEMGEAVIENYNLDRNTASGEGGAVYDKSTKALTIANDRDSYLSISENKAGGDGGAVWMKTGDLTISRYNITGNNASGNGGAVYAVNDISGQTQSVDLTACFEGNTAGVVNGSGQTAKGGALYAAAENGSTELTIDGYLTGNSAAASGGAVYVTALKKAAVTITDQVSGNTAANGSGGGIYAAAKSIDLTLTGNLDQNRASFSGGGIYAAAVNRVKTAVRGNVTDNQASNGFGGGIYAATTDDDGEVALTVNADNSLDPNPVVLEGNSAGRSGGGIYVDTAWASAVVHGGMLDNHATGGDGGAAALLVSEGIMSVDFSLGDISNNTAQRSGGAVWISGSTSTSIGSSVLFGTAKGTMYEMSGNVAENGSGGAVYCTAGDEGIVDLGIYSYNITNNTAAVFGGAVYHTDGLFRLNYTTAEKAAADDPTIASGESRTVRYSLSKNTANSNGGAVYHTGGDFKAFAVYADGNKAKYGSGGVFYLDDAGDSEIWLSSFINNEAQTAGGAVWQGTADSLTINNVLIAANALDAMDSFGGGLYSEADTLNITGSTIANNTAIGSGGGLYLANGNAAVYNTILAYNEAQSGMELEFADSAAVSGDYNFTAYETKDIWDNAGAAAMIYYDDPAELLSEDISETFPNYAAGNYMLGTNSRAVDAGNNDKEVTVYDLAGYTNDQSERIVMVTDYRIDMGAYELTDTTPSKKQNVQRVQMGDATQSICSDETITLSVVHKTNNVDDLTSLSLRVHFNSNILTFNEEFSEVLVEQGLVVANGVIFQVKDDTEDFDSDASTDKYIQVTWNCFAEGVEQWEIDATETLMQLSFTAGTTNHTQLTSINFTDEYHTYDYKFSSRSYSLTIKEQSYFDVDYNGVIDLNDVSMIIRYFEGGTDFTDLVDLENAKRISKTESGELDVDGTNEKILAFLTKYQSVYNLDGGEDGFTTELDGEILRRYFSGYRECGLTWNLWFENSFRTKPDSLTRYLEQYVPGEVIAEDVEDAQVYHQVSGSADDIVNGQNVTLKVSHQMVDETGEAVKDKGSSLSLRIYFNGDNLDFVESESGFVRTDGEVFSKDVVKGYTYIVRDDADDEDGDETTTKYILVTWNCWDGEWSAKKSEEIFQAVFTPKSSEIEGQLNFNFGHEDLTANYGFKANSVSITSRSLNLDVDENGGVDLSDVNLMYRYLSGKRGEELVSKLTETSAEIVEANLDYENDPAIAAMLDLNGNGSFTTDDVSLLMRYLVGYTGEDLTEGLLDTETPGAYTTAKEVTDHIDLYWPQTAAGGSAAVNAEVIPADALAMSETVEPQVAGILLYANAAAPLLAVDASVLLADTVPVTIGARVDSAANDEEEKAEKQMAQEAVFAGVFSAAENWNTVEIDAIAEETVSEYEDDLLEGLLEINLDD